MSVDPPATIAILGAGPIGLEAALYARFLGYDVIILEALSHAAESARLGHVPMFAPFALSHSPLGLAAVQMHHEGYIPPNANQHLTGHEWYERYLLPLAQTDLLADHLKLNHRVIGVTKTELLKADCPANEGRGEWMFRVVAEVGGDSREEFEAEIVIDATGLKANWSGEGGLPALGEEQYWGSFLGNGIPNLDWKGPRKKLAGLRVLVIGSGDTAATNIASLARLKEEIPSTDITWLVRQPLAVGQSPFRRIPDDPFPGRRELADTIEKIVATNQVRVLSGSWMQRVGPPPESMSNENVTVTFGGQHTHSEDFGFIHSHVGERPYLELFRELQVRVDPITESPLRSDLAGGQALITTEPNFYILGSKSYGRLNRDFQFTDGLQQIRDLFAIIGDRPTLDLYAHAPRA